MQIKKCESTRTLPHISSLTFTKHFTLTKEIFMFQVFDEIDLTAGPQRGGGNRAIASPKCS